MTDENDDNEHAAKVPVRMSWAALNAGSSAISTGSDLLQTLDDLVHIRVNQVLRDVGNVTMDGVSGMRTCFELGFGINLPVAPEALGITKCQWHSLQHMIDPLREWSEHEFPLHLEVQPYDYEKDVKVFLEAARVLTMASALSYAREKDAQKIVDKNWIVKVIRHDDAEAMLFLEKNPDQVTGRRPVAILAFRGTEQPDVEACGRCQFLPDWWRNFSFQLTPYRRDGDDCGSVAFGFLAAWRGIRDGEVGLKGKFLQEMLNYGRAVDLFVTGHSQGGALAAVSLLDLLKERNESMFRVRGCLTVAQPRIGDEVYSNALHHAVEQAHIPYDLVGNEDITGVDPIVALGGLGTEMPIGRFWKVRVGKKTRRPETQDEHKKIVEASFGKIAWRSLASAPLHWPGGRHGYLAALAD